MRYFGNGARTCPRGSIISPTYRSPGVQPFAVGRTTEFFRTGNLWAFRAEVIWDPHICLVETFVFFVPQPNPLRWSGQCQLCLALAAIGVCESESAQRGPIAGRAAIRGDAFEVLVGARRIAPGNNEGQGFRSLKTIPAPKPRSAKAEGSGTTIPSRNQRSPGPEGPPLNHG